jgi:hypothetical protein
MSGRDGAWASHHGDEHRKPRPDKPQADADLIIVVPGVRVLSLDSEREKNIPPQPHLGGSTDSKESTKTIIWILGPVL